MKPSARARCDVTKVEAEWSSVYCAKTDSLTDYRIATICAPGEQSRRGWPKDHMEAKTCKGKPAVNKKGWRRSVQALSHHVLGEYNQFKNKPIAAANGAFVC